MERGSIIDGHQEYIKYCPLPIIALRVINYRTLNGARLYNRENKEDQLNDRINYQHQIKLLDEQRTNI